MNTTTTTNQTPSEEDLLRIINSVYCDLSPENLYCDGEISHSQARIKYARLQRELKAAFKLLGRTVDESESWKLVEDLPRQSNNDWMRLWDIRRSLGATTVKTANPSSDNTKLAARYGLPSDIVGRTFKVQGVEYKVTGFNTRRPKYPVNCERVRDGRLFKFPASAIQVALSRVA